MYAPLYAELHMYRIYRADLQTEAGESVNMKTTQEDEAFVTLFYTCFRINCQQVHPFWGV
jgi:hypothetical protein